MKSSITSQSHYFRGGCQEKTRRTKCVGITGHLERTQGVDPGEGGRPSAATYELCNICLSDPQFLFLEKCLTYLLSGVMWGSGETTQVKVLVMRPSTLSIVSCEKQKVQK